MFLYVCFYFVFLATSISREILIWGRKSLNRVSEGQTFTQVSQKNTELNEVIDKYWALLIASLTAHLQQFTGLC